MQSISSRIWTRVAVSISYDDNHYTTGTSNKKKHCTNWCPGGYFDKHKKKRLKTFTLHKRNQPLLQYVAKREKSELSCWSGRWNLSRLLLALEITSLALSLSLSLSHLPISLPPLSSSLSLSLYVYIYIHVSIYLTLHVYIFRFSSFLRINGISTFVGCFKTKQ